jgi:hypothetical protein
MDEAQERDREPPKHEPEQEPDREGAAMACATCGRSPEDEAAARLTWALGVERGRQVWTCDRCSRLHLRSIEGKLDSTWW